MSRGTLLLTIGLAFASFAAQPALGATCRDVEFPDTVATGGADLALNGLGLRKATFLNVVVYVAGLYLPQKSRDARQILGTNQSWRLTLRFVRNVDSSDLRDAVEEGFGKTGANLAPLRARIDALKARLVDFKNGQSLSFSNDPAKGVAVDANGASGNAIEGSDFAAALLSIWLGSEPPNADLKSGLLGGTCE